MRAHPHPVYKHERTVCTNLPGTLWLAESRPRKKIECVVAWPLGNWRSQDRLSEVLPMFVPDKRLNMLPSEGTAGRRAVGSHRLQNTS